MNAKTLKWHQLLEVLEMGKEDLSRILFPTHTWAPRAMDRLISGEGYLKPQQLNALLFITGLTHDTFKSLFSTEVILEPSEDVMHLAKEQIREHSDDVYLLCKRDAVVLFNLNLKAERKTFDLNPESSHRIENEIKST